MLGFDEAGLVLAVIRSYHENTTLDAGVIRDFHDRLLPSASLDECLTSITDWYEREHHGRPMTVDDLNRRIIGERRRPHPTAETIACECHRLGIDGKNDTWMYWERRMLGDTPEHALQALADDTQGAERRFWQSLMEDDLQGMKDAVGRPIREELK